jgi:hypothetical protein
MMSPVIEPEDIEQRLRHMQLAEAPDELWDRVQAELARPARRSPSPLVRRVVRSPVFAVAAVFIALLGGAYLGVLIKYGSPDRWEVMPIAGAPRVAGVSLDQRGELTTGEWLTTDSVSSAQLAVGDIGTAEVGPNSRLQLARGARTQHRIRLERGSLDAVIDAPPRLFFVETPSALATDLGCAYTLEVDDAGASHIHVTAGWVELRQGNRTSLVPAGLVAEVDVGGAPGTPYPAGMADSAHAALARLDRGVGSSADLDAVLQALYPTSRSIRIRQQNAIALWHLLQRVEGEFRTRVYQQMALITPPPEKVTREGILALDRPMLERWRRDLSPMWSEETQPLVVRVLRRLWEWTVR